MNWTRWILIAALALAAPSTALAQPAEIEIATPPPPVQVEVRPVAPSAAHIWIAGHWIWAPMQRQYVWNPGHWLLPPQTGMIWTPATWVQFNGFWRFVPGHWRPAGQVAPPPEQLVQVRMAPPPPQQEVQTAMPSAGMVWVGGSWVWNGVQHVWVPGHWVAPPAGFRVWVPGHWYSRGGFWFFAPGHWQNA
jgi:hypothetical protein